MWCSRLDIIIHISSFRLNVNANAEMTKCKTPSLRRLVYLHQLTRVRAACLWYSDESLPHPEQDSWPTMYLTIFYRGFQRLSHIANTWFISGSQNPQIRIYATFLITSFDEYIEVCSLESGHQCRAIGFSILVWIFASRLFDFDLHRYTIFFQRDRSLMRFTCLTFTNRRSTFSSITRWWRRRLMTSSRNLLSKAISKVTMRRKKWRKKI